jgi:putative ABC transport system permease protein
MIFKLSLKNLVSKKLRSGVSILTIALASFALLTFLNLNAGLTQSAEENIENVLSLNQISVLPKPQNAALTRIFSSEQGFSDKEITQISEIAGIEKVIPQTQFDNFASISANIFGMNLTSDAMIFGSPGELFKEDISAEDLKKWQNTDNQDTYPVILPRKILDLYNLTIARPRALPELSSSVLKGKKLTLYPNYSTFFPAGGQKSSSIKLEVLGFSEKTNLLGVTVPPELIEQISENVTVSKLFINVENLEETTKVAQEIEKLGYTTDYFQKRFTEFNRRYQYLQVSIAVISIIILLISALAILNTQLSNLKERRREIGLFKALGATDSQIVRLVLSETVILTLVANLLAIPLTVLANNSLNKEVTSQIDLESLEQIQLFLTTPANIIACLAFTLIINIMASLVPAILASKISAIRAMR